MRKLIDRPMTAAEYEQAALEYFKTLPLEHFMEAIPHSTQRKIALESLDVLHVRRPDVQVFSELLVQYYHKGVLSRVVPDNMVRLHTEPPVTKGSFNIELEPVRPLWVLEWVSSTTEGKDYEDSFRKYERELRVPYCLMFQPDDLNLQMYRHAGRRYKLIPKNRQRRQLIPELDLEVGLLDEWVRFWHQGELLGLPADLLEEIDRLKSRYKKERRKAAEEKRRAEQEKQRAEQEKQRAEQEKQRAEQEKQRAEQEKQQRLAAEAEVARLRALLEQRQESPPRGTP